MHEYGLVGALIERVTEEAARHGAAQVSRVHLRLGRYAGVERELFARAFETFREHTVCAGSELAIEDAPGDELVLCRIEMEVP